MKSLRATSLGRARRAAAIRARIRTVALLSSCLLYPPVSRADDPISTAIAGLQQRYAAVNTVTASFVQTYRATGMNQTESGTLWMKKPGLMYWEYRFPEPKYFYADGRRTYLYVPADRQVMLRSFTEEDLHSTPLEFLLGKGKILLTFGASRETEIKSSSNDTVMVRLTPKAPDLDYSYLVLEIDSRTFDLRRIAIRERTGNLSDFAFTEMRTNVKINDNRFRFQMPKGVEVIELDEK